MKTSVKMDVDSIDGRRPTSTRRATRRALRQGKSCFSLKKNDFNPRMAWGAPILWLKYTVHTHWNLTFKKSGLSMFPNYKFSEFWSLLFFIPPKNSRRWRYEASTTLYVRVLLLYTTCLHLKLQNASKSLVIYPLLLNSSNDCYQIAFT